MLPQVKARYTARALGCYFGRAGADGAGNAQVFVPFEILDQDFAGERITWAGTFGEGKSTGFTLDALKHLGWLGDDLSELDDLDHEGAARLLPNNVEISCDVEEYQGEVQLKVKWVNPLGGMRMTKAPLTGQDLKAFAAQMRGTIRGTRPSTQSSQRAASARSNASHPNAPGNGIDDPPF